MKAYTPGRPVACDYKTDEDYAAALKRWRAIEERLAAIAEDMDGLDELSEGAELEILEEENRFRLEQIAGGEQ